MMKAGSEAPYPIVKAAAQNVLSRLRPPRVPGMFVGHSLGGSVAQVLGLLFGLPFMTFNAPGMRYDLMRKGFVRQANTAAVVGAGPLPTIGTMVPGGRQIADEYVKMTPGLDQDYDHARLELARAVGIPVPDATAAMSPDYQLGFNFAHKLDTIHQLTGPPIGEPFRDASWPPGFLAAVGAALVPPDGVYYYHDSKKLAEFIKQQKWVVGNRSAPSSVRRGRIFYARTH